VFGRALAVPVMLRQVPSRGEAHGDGEPALLRLVEALPGGYPSRGPSMPKV
jgi:hypothetical protein